MVEKLKLTLAHFFIRKKYLRNDIEPIVFNKIISGAIDVFVIMPEDDNDFNHSIDFIKYLNIHKKIVTVFMLEHKYNLFSEKDKCKQVLFNVLEKTKLNLPKHELVNRLHNKRYDAVVDLNRKSNIFYSAVANIIDSKVRISFKKQGLEGYYNFLFNDNQNNSEVSFRNLLNNLQMF